mgnify:CR=1 FL=1
MLTASIVTYNNDIDELEKAINSILNTKLKVKLYISDNSINQNIKQLCNDERIEYIYNNANLGFGKAHNIAIKKAIQEGSKYHIIINPDIYFEKGVIEALSDYMAKNKKAGIVMPKVLYPDGSLQRLCKMIPTPVIFFIRRFFPIKYFKDYINKYYEMRNFNYDTILNVPILSGCFLFCRTDVLKEVHGFDERFFMYLEDFDLCRRIGMFYQTIFYPYVGLTEKQIRIYKAIR